MEQTFTTVSVFTYSSEAKIFKGRLESEGIKAFLSDDLTIDTDPLVSNAIGGVKLKVLTKDLEKAKEILQSVSKYSLDDNGNDIHCPNCESSKINFLSHVRDLKSLLAFIFGFFLVVYHSTQVMITLVKIVIQNLRNNEHIFHHRNFY